MKEKKLKKKLNEFVELLKEHMDEDYDLVYVDYSDSFPNDQVAILLTEQYPWEYLDMEWEWESRNEGMRYVLKELVDSVVRQYDIHPDVVDAFEDSVARGLIEEMIEERESGKWYDTLLSQTSAPIMRVAVDDVLQTGLEYEDSVGYATDEEAFRDELENNISLMGLDVEENRKALDYLFAELCDPYYTGFLIFRPTDLAEVVGAQWDDVIEVTDPHLWLTDPLAGDGWMEQLSGKVCIKRSDIKPDSSAWGVEDVFGINPSAVDAEVKVVESSTTVTL